MVDQVQQMRIYPYDGAQDSTKHPLLIDPKDIVDSDNIIYTNYSTKKKRPGISEAFSARIGGNRRILGIVDFWRLGNQKIVYYDGQAVYSVDPDGTRTGISTGVEIPTDETVSFVKFQGLLCIFFGGGATPPKKWNQSGVIEELSSNLETYPEFGRVWLNCLWVPDPAVPGRLLKSNTNDPTDFVGGDANVFDLDVNDGDPEGITAIFPPFFGSLYVAKRYSIFKLTPVYLGDGSSVFSVEKIVDGIGCISHNAVVAVESTVIFPSDRGIHYMQSTDKLSTIDTTFLSEKIQPEWYSGTNFRRSKFMQAVYDIELNSYLIFFPRQGRNFPTDVWGFSLPAAKWYRWRAYNHTSACRYVDFNTKKLRTMVGGMDGDFGFIDTTTFLDYGAERRSYIEGGIIAPGDPNNRYQFNSITPVYVPQNTGIFTVTYKVNGAIVESLDFDMTSSELGDNLGEDFALGQSVLGGLAQVKMDSQRTVGSGNFISMRVDHDPAVGVDEGFELLGVLVDVSELNKVTGEVIA